MLNYFFIILLISRGSPMGTSFVRVCSREFGVVLSNFRIECALSFPRLEVQGLCVRVCVRARVSVYTDR